MRSKCTSYQRQIFISDKCSERANNAHFCFIRRRLENTILFMLQRFSGARYLCIYHGDAAVYFLNKK